MSSDEAAMQQAFADFMNGGQSKSKVTTPSSPLVVLDAEARMELETVREVQAVKKLERKYWQILHAFQGSLERDWLAVDDNLGGVVSSIANLRGRIVMESRKIFEQRDGSSKQGSWKRCGYRASGMDLTLDDIQLALSHDLLQHENMMLGARTLLASMADAQESLGRRLEELMVHHMDTMEVIQSLVRFDPQSSSIVVVMGMVDGLQEIYTSLAAELYRKQSSVQTLLDATNDDLLITGEERVTRQDQDPRALAEKCSMSWSRRSTSSCVVESSIQALLQLGDRSNG
jgi:hypothetical protein